MKVVFNFFAEKTSIVGSRKFQSGPAERQTNRRTDGQTDRQIERQTERKMIQTERLSHATAIGSNKEKE